MRALLGEMEQYVLSHEYAENFARQLETIRKIEIW